MVEGAGDGSSTEQEDLTYNGHIEEMRKEQYPMLGDSLYLDHAGTTLTSKRLMDKFHYKMVTNLYGNPHSFSQASHRTAEAIDSVRVKLLAFLKADPLDFDVVFTANATAAVKLVAEALRDHDTGFRYFYHNESHTSLVGVRELAEKIRCFGTDVEIEAWLREDSAPDAAPPRHTLFAYPAQSNLNGRLLPLTWCGDIRRHKGKTWSLLDAAAHLATAPIDLGDAANTPDFIALSLYKIFGFPDLGALLVRRRSAHALYQRKYFGGGTVDMVVNDLSPNKTPGNSYMHVRKTTSIHERLEDGTLPYHSIVALDCAISAHSELFDSLDRVSRHTRFLAQKLHSGLAKLKHDSGQPVVQLYSETVTNDDGGGGGARGPVIAFNLQSSSGRWVSLYEFEKIAIARDVNVRTGGHCNPGGTASYLDLAPQQIRINHDAGHRCGSEFDIVNHKPTGMIRVSLGAMSTLSDVDRFLAFLDEFYVERDPEQYHRRHQVETKFGLQVERLTVYPIKSCAGWTVPEHISWDVRPEGLAWDREWCVVNALTEKVLSQKRYPKMALIRPELDISGKILRVHGMNASDQKSLSISVALDRAPDLTIPTDGEVCGTTCNLALYQDPAINGFFTECIGVPCRLARFPNPATTSSRRHAKEHLNRGLQGLGRTIAFSNESPILTITRASLNRLNETIKQHNGKAASPAVFRANIVLRRGDQMKPGDEAPYAEDGWSGMTIGKAHFDFLGGCRRCQMVCIDQRTGERNAEPFSTLAKTRRINGRVLFGIHTALAESRDGMAIVKVGDEVALLKKPESEKMV
ncbi:Molybdenum cofactor sulfurase-like protein 2 [Elsinoe fawcettii]|nr:Molybdenum cofactor sulfurase-like protein 2 [Elsinoe fawcettii]